MTLNLACNGISSPRTTRMDCDHLKTHMPRYFFNLTNDIRTVVDADVCNSKTKRPCGSKLWKWSRVSVRKRAYHRYGLERVAYDRPRREWMRVF